VGKQRSRSEEQLIRQWRGCGLLSLAVAVGLGALYVAAKLMQPEHTDGQHVHHPAPHGGVIASAGDEEGHYHVEALADRGHTIKFYTYGENLDDVLEVEHQIVTAQVKREGDAETTPVVLMPMPQPLDADGNTSRFFCKLPKKLRGKPLTVHVPGIDFAGRRFPLDFTVASPEMHGSGDEEQEENVLLFAGGKYTDADIRANGGMTASHKYKVFEVNHDDKPRRGERLCPISRTKANQQLAWVIGGKSYVFCCPPCIQEFVRQAKQEPREIKDPESYVKK
jgi:hypothetical protein